MWKSTAPLICVLAMSGCAGDDGSDSPGDDTAAVSSTSDGGGTSSGSSSESGSGSTDLLPETESSDSDDPSDTNIDATLTSGSSSSGGESGGNTDCPMLDATACAEASDCAVIEASAVVEDTEMPGEWCMATSEVVGCRSADENCAAVLTFACDRDGNVYEIGSACIPRNWSVCESPAVGAPDCG